MCTLSWLHTNDSYQLFFNRDEQRTRELALAPRSFMEKGVKVLMPIDPEGGGSWIAVNEYGLSACLLNYYQGSTATPITGLPLISRGKLLRVLSCSPTLDALQNTLSNTSLNYYAPFTLVAFAALAELNTHSDAVRGYQWNGLSLQHFQPESMITSSSFKFQEVAESRHQLYQQVINTQSVEQHVDFHTTHAGSMDYRSVCMHRDDAKTVSFSHIQVSTAKVIFSYQQGSPCESASPVITEIAPTTIETQTIKQKAQL